MEKPTGWMTDYSTSDFDYRTNLSARRCIGKHYLAEAVPEVGPHLAPNCLALYLGCRGLEMPDTVWCEPFMDRPEDARFEFDPENYYWNYTLRLAEMQLDMGRGKFQVSFPDLIEGLDTLAAMRGTKNLLLDLRRRPEWVKSCLRQITDRYFHYYDILYDMLRDEVGGSNFWAWAPGRMAKFQCDFSAMISPEMFGEFMVPVFAEMCERVSYCMYHWDGPPALPHHDHLLSIPGLKMLQWTPGWGAEPTWHKRWWPIYHKTIDAGKKLLIGCDTMDHLDALVEEFGQELKQFIIQMDATSLEQADEILKRVSD
jgi:5-methyltetrahydrofolate--homocysteine methyltransferase